MADSDGPVVRSTLTEQITARLSNAINDGTYPPGQQLPSEGELAKRYGVSRPVVRNALDALRRQGLISTVNGVGSYARELRPPQEITRTNADPWDSLIPDGASPTNRRDYADACAAAIFGVPEGEMLFITTRPATREQTGQKVLTARVIPLRSFEGIKPAPAPFERTRADLVDIFARHLGPLIEAEAFRAVSAAADQATELGVPAGAALVQLTRLTRAADGRLLMTETELTDGAAAQYVFVHTPAR
jgi:GntR family transcriptional regulator